MITFETITVCNVYYSNVLTLFIFSSKYYNICIRNDIFNLEKEFPLQQNDFYDVSESKGITECNIIISSKTKQQY